MVESDGTASDVLVRVLGGANEIQSYLTQIGIQDMKVVNTEKELGQDWQTQYQNWATPVEAVKLLRSIRDKWVLDTGQELKQQLLISFMLDSVTGPHRLRGLLPKDTSAAHKTGTSGTRDGITAATNDIGIIDLPNGKHFAIAVFVSDSPADEKTREAVIARIAKAAWNRWAK
jgi:beta-lactamase class A